MMAAVSPFQRGAKKSQSRWKHERSKESAAKRNHRPTKKPDKSKVAEKKWREKRRSKGKRKPTSTDVVPVGVVRSKLLVDAGFDSVDPLGDHELVVVLQDIGIGGDELGGGNVAHCDTSLRFVSHFCHTEAN